ncbi:MAG: molecular chaperone TorD family protein [Longimicrobiales bacterium]|nr:molecular chaperone TorD family protein [Longimicrobiales bacterium]
MTPGSATPAASRRAAPGHGAPSDGGPAARAELIRALAALAELPGPGHPRLARLLGLPGEPRPGAYTDLFLMNLYPYASVHLGAEGMLGGEARDRVAGFWRALGAIPPAEPDHLGALLGLLGALRERTDSAERMGPASPHLELARRARRALLAEHLLPWCPPFLERVRAEGDACYAAWAGLVQTLLEAEARDAREADPALDPPLSRHLAEAPALPDPRADGSPGGGARAGGVASGAEAFLAALLAPVRSGVILIRRDLARAGHELGMGVRQGERRYVLKALLGQDACATLRWLAEEARRQASCHRGTEGWDAPTRTFWEARARATARLLDELAADAAEAPRTVDPG